MRQLPSSENVVIQVGNKSQQIDGHTKSKHGRGKIVYKPVRSEKHDNELVTSVERDYGDPPNCTEFLRQGKMKRHIEYYFQNATKLSKVSFCHKFQGSLNKDIFLYVILLYVIFFAELSCYIFFFRFHSALLRILNGIANIKINVAHVMLFTRYMPGVHGKK